MEPFGPVRGFFVEAFCGFLEATLHILYSNFRAKLGGEEDFLIFFDFGDSFRVDGGIFWFVGHFFGVLNTLTCGIFYI